jgi:hypothetical protein
MEVVEGEGGLRLGDEELALDAQVLLLLLLLLLLTRRHDGRCYPLLQMLLLLLLLHIPWSQQSAAAILHPCLRLQPPRSTSSCLTHRC